MIPKEFINAPPEVSKAKNLYKNKWLVVPHEDVIEGLNWNIVASGLCRFKEIDGHTFAITVNDDPNNKEEVWIYLSLETAPFAVHSKIIITNGDEFYEAFPEDEELHIGLPSGGTISRARILKLVEEVTEDL